MYCWHLEAEIILKLTTFDGRVVASMVAATTIITRSYGDKSGRGQKKTLEADDRSDYLDLFKKLLFMNNSNIASNMQHHHSPSLLARH